MEYLRLGFEAQRETSMSLKDLIANARSVFTGLEDGKRASRGLSSS